jgi:ABC-type xylose transport system permease subunit
MKLVYVPWMVLLLAGIVFVLVSRSTLDVVVGSVMALCGLVGWVMTAKRYRGERQENDLF